MCKTNTSVIILRLNVTSSWYRATLTVALWNSLLHLRVNQKLSHSPSPLDISGLICVALCCNLGISVNHQPPLHRKYFWLYLQSIFKLHTGYNLLCVIGNFSNYIPSTCTSSNIICIICLHRSIHSISSSFTSNISLFLIDFVVAGSESCHWDCSVWQGSGGAL